MGAVAGVIGLETGSLESGAAFRMAEALVTPGTGAARAYERDGVALGHVGVAPGESRDELSLVEHRAAPLAIAADVRLDNRTELRNALGVAEATGDAELILAAYERWDEACPERLLGDFAFIIWDGRRRALFCACDRFAVKGLFWHRSTRLAAAATEIKALFALDQIPRRLNELRLADFLTLQIEDPAETIYRDVQRLAAAHSLTLTRDGARLRRYWHLDLGRAWENGADADYEEAFRTAFTRSVHSRLDDRDPVATMLSGGLDSSSVAVVARNELAARGRLPLHSMSAIFDAVAESDEREYIHAVLATGGFQPHFVHPERLGPLDDWAGAAWRGDEPEPHGQVSIGRSLYAAASEAGARCLLDGLGGDFVVSFGAELLTELAVRGRWVSLWREAHALGRSDFTTTRALLRTFVVAPFVPEAVTRWRMARGERKTGTPHWSGGTPIDPGFALRAGLGDRYDGRRVAREREPRDPRRAQAGWVTSAIVPLGLGIYDRIGRHFGVEPRYPFLDSQLVELCLSIPPDQKLRNGLNRDLVRRALGGSLPEAVRRRQGKGRPGVHIAHSLPATGRHVMDEVVLGDMEPLRPYVELARLREQYRRCLAGADAYAWFPIYRVVVAALWLQQAQARHGLQL
jgi:asparagine synthase (glutamine-hydrolysing)